MLATRLTLLAVVAALSVAGCGGDDDEPAAGNGDTTATAPATGTTPETSTPEGGGETTQPGSEGGEPEDGETATGPADRAEPQGSPGRGCLTGVYVSSSFQSKRSFDSPVGPAELSGRGRGLALEFRGAAWTMRGIGRRPMRGEVFGIEGTLRVNGSVRGRLIRAPGKRLRFRQTGSRGTVTLSGLGQSFELPVSAVARTVVPEGRAQVTCRGRRLTIDSESGVLRVKRP